MRAIAYDTETTGLRPHRGDEMFAFSTCDPDGRTTVVRMEDRLADARLRAVVGSARPLVMHNAKFDLAFTEKRLGRRIAERVHFDDTRIMSHMLRNDHHGHGLKELTWELAGIPKDDEAEVRRYVAASKSDYSAVPREVMDRYQARDARRTMLLWLFFSWKLAERSPKLRDCYAWERDVVLPTMRLEQRGVMLDVARTRKIVADLKADAEVAATEFCALYGRRVNLGSDNALRYILYSERRMPVLALTDKSRQPSVEKEVLEELYAQTRDPLLQLAVRYKARRLGVGRLEGYLKAADEEGIIHPTINTLGAKATGRESSQDPNLQNVEKEGRLKNPFPTPARRCFRPRPGFVNFHVDYAGIELRLLVHYSKDPELVREIFREGGDPHALAAGIFYPPFTEEERGEYATFAEDHPTIAAGFEAWERKSKEWSQLRDPAKNTNFAVPYGADAKKAAQTLGIPLTLGLKRFAEYQARFPRLCSMTRDIVATVKENGGIETTFGRFLRVPREKAYAGVNYTIQGTAAEILKRAQVRVHRLLEGATGGECGLLLPIHDELVIEWPRKRLADAPALWRKIREEMIDFPQFDVPLDVEVQVTTTDWSQKVDYKFKEK